ncbi:MAG: TlyA family RNA methyltransferase [Desulfomonilaceae bacterium]|nr:TlyA family RNA methyltransferase [Desulfomonilaceae bacterium]
MDSLLVERRYAASRQRAAALIMAGKVTVDGVLADKPGKQVLDSSEVTVREDMPYVSRGGIKLAGALDAFGRDPSGLAILDAGASTGGFTDCLLQRGASMVIAVDVGYGQIHWNMRCDPRVVVMERVNARSLTVADLPCPIDAAVADLSFISLKLVLPVLRELLPVGGWLLPLIKPQFEVGRSDVGKGGVVRDAAKIRRVVDDLKEFAAGAGFDVLGEVESSIRGPKGNQEYFLNLVKR